MSLQPASTPQQRAGRVLGRLAELFEIGRQAGTNRPGLGEGEQRAHDLVASCAAVRRAVAGIGLDPVDLPSGAGHDAAIMATAGIPSAVLFVRSDAGGVSQAPESTGADAIAAYAHALESALRELAA